MVIYVAVFLDKALLIYIKPIAPLSLILLYVKSVKKIDPLFPLSMVVISITDIFNYIDFIKFFDLIALLISLFYILCLFLLKDFISKEDVKLSKLVSPPVIVSILFITYLIYSIVEIAMPEVGNSLGSIVLIVTSLLSFVAVSFFIYVADRYDKSIFLFISACCTLFVDTILAINELYYYTRVFTVLINIAEIAGLYFFTIFLVRTKLVDVETFKENYF